MTPTLRELVPTLPALSRWLSLTVLSASIGLGACASRPAIHPQVITHGTIPTTGLATTPRIVVNEHAVRLSGPTREEKEWFEKDRSARIDARADAVQLGNPAGALIKEPRAVVCLLPPVMAVCIFAMAGTYASMQGIERIKASRREPSVISVSEKERSRLANIVEERISAAMLGERVARMADSTGAPEAKAVESPQLLIRMKSASLSYGYNGLSLNIHAEAQALPSPSTSWKPTVHIYELPYQKLDRLTKETDEPLRHQMDVILDYLAYDIWETYSPKKGI